MSQISKPLTTCVVFSIASLLLAALLSNFSQTRMAAPYLALALLFCGLIAAASLLVAIGRYILGPLDRAARHRRRPTQFTMVDFLSLMFLFQLPMAALRGWTNLREEPTVWVFYVFGWLATAAMWASSVRTLSRAGVENTWHRGVFLAFVLPAAYFGSIVFTASLFTAAIFLFSERAPTRFGFAAILATDAALLAAFFLSAKFVRKMTAASGAEAELDSPREDSARDEIVPVEPRESFEPLAQPMPGAEANVDHP